MSWSNHIPNAEYLMLNCASIFRFDVYTHLVVHASIDCPDNKLSHTVFLVSIGWDDATWHGIW